MFVTAQMLAAECGVTEKTIMAHVRKMERSGYPVRAQIGRPTQINRERFMKALYPGWRDDNEY